MLTTIFVGLRDMQAVSTCHISTDCRHRQLWCLHTSSTWRPGDKKVAVRAITDSEARRPCKLLSGSRVTDQGSRAREVAQVSICIKELVQVVRAFRYFPICSKITMCHSYQWLPTGAGLGPSTATFFPIISDIINKQLYDIKWHYIDYKNTKPSNWLFQN